MISLMEGVYSNRTLSSLFSEIGGEAGIVKPEFVDTHCHLDLDDFEQDRSEVLERAFQAGVKRIVIPGITLASSRVVGELAMNYSGLFAAVGVHPTEATTWDSTSFIELVNLVHIHYSSSQTSESSRDNRIVAIGEIGLDYYWNPETRLLQLQVLRQQLELAAKVRLPVILHFREPRGSTDEKCARDLLVTLKAWVDDLKTNNNSLASRPGVLHSFSGSIESAQAAIEMGFYIGVTGPVTFKNAKKRQELITILPLDCLLIETDAPFLAPQPHRGRRNEPAFVALIADKIATLHTCSLEDVANITSANAARLFGWETAK